LFEGFIFDPKSFKTRKMKKLIYCMTLLAGMLFVAGQVNAQESFGSAGLEIAIPIGDFSDAGVNFGIGGSGTYEIGLSDNFAVLAHAGVIFYATDDIEIPVINPDFTIGTETVDYNVYQIPLQVGGRYYLSEQKEGLFLSALLGLHITGVSVDGEGDSSTDFSFAPEVGYFVNENISLAARFQIVEDANYLGLRAAYNF
jgi:hypothetical protein